VFRKHTLKRSFKTLIVLVILALTVTAALAQEITPANRGDYTQRPLPTQVTDAKLNTPIQLEAAGPLLLNPELRGLSGRQQVVVRLRGQVAATESGGDFSAPRQQARADQNVFIAAARSADATMKVLATTQLVMNAVVLEIDASALPTLAQNPDVVSINPVRTYEMDLSETVPYIGATAVHDLGFDGTGVRVAVLDSGIDYYHADLGGSGDPDDYANDDPMIIEPGTFPTDKVVGGYDFVGSEWDGTATSPPEMPDPDPLDDGPGAFHGTHVADIIGGQLGVAPGADLYAVKVCSSITSSCSGIALLQAMEFAVDPNGDGNTSDKVDIINMSLGSPMGDPFVDDLSFAVEGASALGVLVVTSSGNSSDVAYITGTPGAAPSALSVAQTNVPSAVQPLMEVTEPADIAGLYAAIHQDWSAPLTEVVEGPLQYGDGAGGDLLGCSLGADPNSTDPANAPFPPGSLTGKIVLVDRGTCSFSIKINNIQYGGGLAGIIGLVAPGEPFSGAYGGGGPFTIPGFMISQTDSTTLKSGLDEGVHIVFDPANGIDLVGHMVGTSSRGPSVRYNQIKPDIGAPGASVSAEVGTGTGRTPFGGTSGAAPMVTGSAALLMDAYPDRSWSEIKSVLMNTGETNIMNEPEFFGGELAPITRIGGGEVRVDRALLTPVAAWDWKDRTGSLSFGFHEVSNQTDLVKQVTIRNYSSRAIMLHAEPTYRFDNDTAGEVRVRVTPSWFTVPAHGRVTIRVRVFIRPWPTRPLHDWFVNSGSNGANPDALTLNEYDGYINFTGVGAVNSDVAIHMPWQVLPRGAGDIQTAGTPGVNAWARNMGMSESFIDTFSLIGVSGNLPSPAPGSNIQEVDLKYVGVQTYPVAAGECGPDESFVMAFAVNTWERQTHANTTSFQFWLDIDEDGSDDFVVLNRDTTFSNVTSGSNLTWVLDLVTGDATAFFFTEHYTNSANTTLYFCGDQIGLDADAFLAESMDVDLVAQDFYYGLGGDMILDMNVVPLGERYLTVFENDDIGFTVLPPRSPRLHFTIVDFGDQLNETETGVLWLYGPGARNGNEAKTWILQP
jgi:subtilisin family serine protease